MKNFGTFLLLIGVLTVAVSCDYDTKKHTNGALSNINAAASEDGDDAEIENLCESKNIVNCVRDVFAKMAECTKVRLPKTGPLHLNAVYSYVPVMNATFILKDTTLKNIKGTIEKFYLNKKTGNLVISVKLDGVKVETKDMQMYVHRKGKEPKLVKDKARGIYPGTLTAIIPAKEKITPAILKKYSVSGYVPSSVDFYIGPRVMENKDPVIKAAVQALAANLPTVIQELYLTGAPGLFLTYLQQHICDFGISYENAYGVSKEATE